MANKDGYDTLRKRVTGKYADRSGRRTLLICLTSSKKEVHMSVNK